MPQFNSVPLRRQWRLSALLALMSAAPLLVCAQAPAPALIRDGLAPANAQVAVGLPAYLQARQARFVDWLSDGSVLIATRFGEQQQIHRLRAPLAMREQMSFAESGVMAASARPYASDALVYLASRPGSDHTQLFLQPLASQPPVALTDGSHRDGPALWAHDGKRLAFTSNRRNATDVDIYLIDSALPAATPRLLLAGNGARWHLFDWSVDDKRLLLGRELGDDSLASAEAMPECEIFQADVASGELTPLSIEVASRPESGRRAAARSVAAAPVRARSARFATDGHGILLLTRQSAAAAGGAPTPYLHLSYTDSSGREWRDVSVEAPRDVERFDQSVDGHYLAYTLNDNGISRLVLIDQARKLDLNIGELPAGVIRDLKFDDSGKRLALSIESVRSPADVYVFEPDTHALTRWTQSELGALDVRTFAAAEPLHFPTWDRLDGQAREIPALLYRAPPAVPAAPRAVLILLRGAGAQSRPGFDPFVQYLVASLGVVVVAPNLRGASGYGAAFAQLGQGALRDDATRDVGSLLVWIGLQSELDRNRIVLLGEGEGAYLALQSLATYGDRLLGAIAAFPPHLSPLTNITSLRRPVLLVQGLNNPAAPAYELEQLRSRLRVSGVAASYLAAADEAQQFERASNRAAYLAASADFLAQLLR